MSSWFKPSFHDCYNIKLSFGVLDPIPKASSFEEAAICALIQIRQLLAKIAYSIAPSIDRSYLMEVGAQDFERVYHTSEERVIEIQNISNLTNSPNDLIIQTSFLKVKTKTPNNDYSKKLGLVVKPDERIRLHVPPGNSIYAKFVEEQSFIAISELLF